MSITLSNLKPAKGSQKESIKIGRGGKRGSYSGRGMKGQRARSGGKRGLRTFGLQQTVRRIPKLRGFRSAYPKLAVVNVGDLEKKFSDGELIDAAKLIRVGLVEQAKNGIKILGNGKLTKKFSVTADAFSTTAKTAIEAAGGSVEIKK